MHRGFAHGAVWFLGFALTACASKNTGSATCVDSDPKCGVACNTSHPCAAGLHCGSDSLCAKSCTQESGCPSDQHCSATGSCVAGAPPAKIPESKTDAGDVDNPGLIKDSGMIQVTDAAYMQPGECQRADVSATRVIPTVVLVIDQSGSMTEKFGSGDRWNVLRDFLLKPDGLIASLETQVRFGIAMYSAIGPMNGMPLQCPIVTSVTPAVNNFAAISTAYKNAVPLNETPTGDSIDKIVSELPKPTADQENSPVVLVLATDGEPDRCEELNPQNGQAEAIAAVTHAFEMGIRTFIISVGDEVSTKHQQDVANAGVGHKMGDANAPYWNAGDDATLRTALTEIIGAQVSCDVTLQGSVAAGNPCEGSVELNGVKLECKGKDGWELSDPKHIRLLGKACSDFKTQKTAQVHATFPCSVQVIF
jgi:hypothetical protein